MKAASLLAGEHGLLALPVRLGTALVATLALLLSVIFRMLRPDVPELAALAAFGAWVCVAPPVLVGAVRGLWHRGATLNPHYLDQFVALVLLACFAGERPATGALVAVILIFGQVLEERSVRGIREAVDGLSRIARVPARKLEGAAEELVDADTLQPGNRLRVLPGELVPADARVLSGASALNQAAITGESLPRDVCVGDEVFAGTLNLSGPLEIEVLRAAADTVIGRVHAILAAAGEDRPLVARRIDACLRYYTPAVLFITGITWIVTRDLDRAVAVLVISLPCAFILAGPCVMVAALAVCSRLGVLVKTPRHFETACRLDAVVFDKTGTLTKGQLSVAAARPLASLQSEPFINLAATLARRSQHPVAGAIAALAPISVQLAFEAVEEVPGRGLRGRVDGHSVLLGSAVWLEENSVAVEAPHEEAGHRTVFAAVDGQAVLAFELLDALRPEAASVVRELAEAGLVHSVLLTGDHEPGARAVAAATGLTSWRARCLPEEKRAAVLELRAEGRRVLVVGDGVNDAPALAAGDLAVALNHSGAHIAVQTADVALLGDDLGRLVDFFAVSKRAMRLIYQNLAFAAVLILVSLVLTGLGLVGPLGAAVLHEAGAFFVLINSARLLRYEAM